MKKYIIVHGHFYQPPREDPWSGRIGYQPTAAPYRDWNRRITAECYAANGASRVLDDRGRIDAIVNNYATLSFNFGPTLLSWLETEAPETYGRIIAADRRSVETRNGHGNAVAQSFNHTILPLDTPQDARTQIRWGLEDFRRRFGREAEGMWLPECGINETVLDLLIDEGLQFVVLSPWQAEAIRKPSGKWKKLHGAPAPTNRPFRLRGKSGEIAAFFYHPDLASAISFGHLLTSREKFRGALEAALTETGGPLVSVATDGEIYGHHEPYGDMCLASLTTSPGSDDDWAFTNFGAYLDIVPPTDEVRLGGGDEDRGTSWSCSHGVGRWMRDCGCRTGGEEGWNQQWRSPLRKAFDELREASTAAWVSGMRRLIDADPWEIRDGYGKVLSGEKSPKDYALGILGEKATEEAVGNLLRLLEGQKYVQFMYTSCGWFFSDLAGIEPLQNMKYASRAAMLHQADSEIDLEHQLIAGLQEAVSNVPVEGDGRNLYLARARPSVPPDTRAAALFFWRDFYNLPGRSRSRWGYWRGEGLSRSTVALENGRLALEGEIQFLETPVERRVTLSYRADVGADLFCPEIRVDYQGSVIVVALREMPTNLRREIARVFRERSDKRLSRFMGRQAEERIADHIVVEGLDLPYGAPGWRSLESALYFGPQEILRELSETPPAQWGNRVRRLDRILSYAETIGELPDGHPVIEKFEKLVTELLESLQRRWDDDTYDGLVELLNIARERGYRPVKPYVQNTVFALMEGNIGGEETLSGNWDRDGDRDEEVDGDKLRKLAVLVNINPDRFPVDGRPSE